jgi:gliding motility-associated-like protein
MKKRLLSILFILISLIKGGAQSTTPAIDSKEYENLKQQGLLPKELVLINQQSFSPSIEDLKKFGAAHTMGLPGNPPTTASLSGCSCYIPPDNTYTLALAPNDDGSSNLLNIPFNFCLYGTNYSSLYINNNGNISFVNSYATFSSSSFPDPTYIMVAPFWGDVDTRGAGTVQYKITPTAMYVNWEAVGYFPMLFDKINSFQLIITDGNDPILPAGNNIAFCYGDMQWTTGGASLGVNGFGGTPSTVGVNKGDGVTYTQLGRFDQPGSAFDGGYGLNDGVDWLDNKSFYFNSCSGTNLAPIASGINNCDTIKICGTGDTLILDALFLAPEIGQNTTISVNTYGAAGMSVLSNVSGNSATAQLMIISSGANAGNNLITFTATDNGIPAGTTVINVNVFVDVNSAVNFYPVISGNLSICVGDSSLLSVNPTTYDSYLWNTGSSAPSIYAHTAGQYWVTSTFNGCYRTSFVNLTAQPSPVAAILANNGTCLGGSVTLTASGGGTYLWLNSSDTIFTKTVSPIATTTYTVEVTNSLGCKDSAQATVVIYPPPIADFGTTGVCLNQLMNFTDQSTYTGGTITAWSWDFGDGSPSVFTQNPTHLYTILGTYMVTLIVTTNNGCIETVTKNVLVHPLPIAQFSAGSGCVGSIIPFNNSSTIAEGDNLQVWTWDFGDGSSLNNNQNATHQYANTGSFAAELLVISNFGCRDSVTGMVTITPPLAVNFTSLNTMGCSPLCVNFQNLYIVPPAHQATYLWDFGDGSAFDSASNPTHCFTNSSLTLPQDFNVSLTVTPDTGCVTTHTINNFITVNPTPIADFSLDPNPTSILTPVISFANLSVGATTWDWDLGDLTTSNVNTPLPHTYADTGSYIVSLIATNQFGCADTALETVVIEPDFSFYIPSSFSPNGNGINEKFQGYGYGILEYEMMIYDRWGNEIYYTPDYNLPWDGKVHHGEETAQIDVYVYLFNIKDVKGVKHSYRGIVTLLR